MEIIYTFLSVICFVLALGFLLTYYKRSRTERMLQAFGAENLNNIEVGLSQVSYSNFSQYGGVSLKSTLYYNEHLLLFAPMKNSVFSWAFNSLPLLLVLKTSNELPRVFNYKVIEKIIIKTDVFILVYNENTLTTKKRTEVSIYSEKENSKLTEIFTKYLENMNG
ncbi:MAG: hypothetical protein DCF13_01900 [Flavobacteriaceae bacterium]|nr:MAG: hypothetical protein DCF13_01900 [Flavobacteriaceae bacterium]